MDKDRIARFLITESLPHKIFKVLDKLSEDQKTELKTHIKRSLNSGKITRDEFNLILKHTRELQEIKDLQEGLADLWEIADNSVPILAKELETGFIYPIEYYWIGYDLDKFSASEYTPSTIDEIQMYGTKYELIGTLSVPRYFELR